MSIFFPLFLSLISLTCQAPQVTNDSFPLFSEESYTSEITFFWDDFDSECSEQDCTSLSKSLSSKGSPKVPVNIVPSSTSPNTKQHFNLHKTVSSSFLSSDPLSSSPIVPSTELYWFETYSAYNTSFQTQASKTFDDPMPSLGLSPTLYRCVGASVIFYGRYQCEVGDHTPLVAITLQQIPINNFTTPFPTSSISGCECPSCALEVVLPNRIYLDINAGWYGYNYSGQNTLSIMNLNGANFLISSLILSLTFSRGPPVVVSSVPTGGPASGGTILSLTGVNFFQTSMVYCWFDSRENKQNATIQTHDPNTGDIGFSCVTPASIDLYHPSTISVFVSVTDYHDRTVELSTPFTFNYYVQVNVSGLHPSSGVSEGGTWVSITGSSFVNYGVSCSFNDHLSIATVESTTLVKCLTPGGNGTVLVSLALNGQQYVRAGNYTYYGDEHVPASDSHDFLTDQSVWIYIGAGFGLAILIGLLVVLLRVKNPKIKKIFGVHDLSNVTTDNGSPHDGHAHRVYENESQENESLLGKPSPLVVKVGLNTKNVIVLPGSFDLRELQLQQRIGRGTHGEVFKALWRGTEVAVKNLPQSQLTEELMEDIIREAKIMRTLRHPNVLQFLGASMDPPNFCIIIEFMPLGSLFNLLHDRRINLSWNRIKGMLLDAAKGMNYLHHSEPPIIHRDLKSQNLLVNENWRVKVSDFGLCRILAETPDHIAMTACGTPCWAAPEILRNQRYDKRADVYSYGVVLWECISRRIPYEGMPPFQVVYAVANERRRPIIPEQTSSELSRLVSECWAEQPKDRPMFDEIIERLTKLKDGFILPTTTSTSQSSHSAHPHSQTHAPHPHAHAHAHSMDHQDNHQKESAIPIIPVPLTASNDGVLVGSGDDADSERWRIERSSLGGPRGPSSPDEFVIQEYVKRLHAGDLESDHH